MTPRLLTALNQNGAAMPSVTTMNPPSAGPTARLTLMPTLLAAMALASSGFGTSCGTTACHAGAVIADATVTMNVKTSRLPGVMRCSQTRAAKAVEVTVTAISPTMRNTRRSTMSTSAPAGMAKRNIGSVFATCTSDTVKGSGSSVVINQPLATLYIQPPTLETTVAIQMTANIRWRNGAQAEGTAGAAGLAAAF